VIKTWRKAKKCEASQCIELGAYGDKVFLRFRDGTVGEATKEEFDAFRDGIKKGEFDDV